MATPNRRQIYEKAKELYVQHCYRNGAQALADVNPTYEELAENGFVAVAQSMLMCGDKASVYGVVTGNEEKRSAKGSVEVDIEESLKSGIYACGTTGAGKSDVGMYIAEQLMSRDVIVAIFDGSQDWLNRSSVPCYQTLRDSSIDIIPIDSLIFDISHLSIVQQQSLVESFCERLMKHQAGISKALRKQYFLIFEEAHTYFPEGCMRAKRFQNTVKMMTQGRNFRVRFMAITQFSSLIDKTAMRYMKQRYFGYTDEKNDIAYLRSFLEEDAKRLKTLKAGEFLYYHTGNVKKIEIEPYQPETVPNALRLPEPSLPEQPKIMQHQHDNGKAISSIIVAAMWFIAILLGLSHMP